MESEVKRVSTALSFRLPIFLLFEPFGIHLVSRDIIDGCRASLFRLTDYLKLFRAVVSRIQVKIICGSLYFELVSPCSTSIPYFIALLSLLLSYRRAYLRL
ncbi:hypothetical protein YC2023_094931 [Brassica napus]